MKIRAVSGKAVRHERRNTRRKEAATRQAVRDARSDRDQLVLLSKRPGRSVRERVRLEKKHDTTA